MEPTGKFKKTSVITSEMSADELRDYYQKLIQHAKTLNRELIACREEIANITHLLGGRINENPA